MKDLQEPLHTHDAQEMRQADEYLFTLMRARSLMYAHFDARDVNITGGNIRFEADSVRGDINRIRAAFRAEGFTMYIKKHGPRTIVTLVRTGLKPDAAQKRERKTALILFICTIVTTIAAGLIQASGISRSYLSLALNTLSFPLALILILGSHELAHKFAAKRNGIDSSPPYFIPAPTLTGTFGAVIRVKSPMPDDNAAVEMGLSGPVAGFLMTIPVLILGVMLSSHAPMPAASLPPGSMEFGEPLIFKFIAYTLLGIPKDHMINIHPVAFAGWVGLLVTMMNLFPIGQLDGGHIARAVLGPRLHAWFGHACVGALVAMGIATSYYGWFVWAALCSWVLSRGYPPGNGIIAPLKARNIAYGFIALIIMALCFMPSPIIVH